MSRVFQGREKRKGKIGYLYLYLYLYMNTNTSYCSKQLSCVFQGREKRKEKREKWPPGPESRVFDNQVDVEKHKIFFFFWKWLFNMSERFTNSSTHVVLLWAVRSSEQSNSIVKRCEIKTVEFRYSENLPKSICKTIPVMFSSGLKQWRSNWMHIQYLQSHFIALHYRALHYAAVSNPLSCNALQYFQFHFSALHYKALHYAAVSCNNELQYFKLQFAFQFVDYIILHNITLH